MQFNLLFDALLRDQMFSVELVVVERAKQIALGYKQLPARETVHFAVMQQHGIDRILTFDSGFDACPGLTCVC